MPWEYTTFSVDARGAFLPDVDDTEVAGVLNRYAGAGWELVSVLPVLRNG